MRALGLPPLALMEGFYNDIIDMNLKRNYLKHVALDLPIRWDALRCPENLLPLMQHSDCDGELSVQECRSTHQALNRILPMISDDWRRETKQFIEGCRAAVNPNKPLEFR